MTPQQIKRAKRLAEILGLQVASDSQLSGREYSGGCIILPDGEYGRDSYVFNPEQDKALLWDLKIAYQIDVSNNGNHQWDVEGWTQGMNHVYRSTELTKDQLPAALIDCVIEINGGYDV